jgi:hypothetical protein
LQSVSLKKVNYPFPEAAAAGFIPVRMHSRYWKPVPVAGAATLKALFLFLINK